MVLDVLIVIAGALRSGKFGICTVAAVLLSAPVIQAIAHVVKKTKFLKSIA